MSTPTPPEPAKPAAQPSAVAVISATGAFRVLLILLAVWSFFEGFALFTGAVSALSLGGHDRTAERIIGAQMIVFVPVYALLAWNRERYRLLIWVPYGAQLAIILPTIGNVVRFQRDGAGLFVISLTFFVLLFYFWWHSHPLDFFSGSAADEYDDEDEDASEDDEDDGEGRPSSQRAIRARDGARRPGRFRRRDT